MRIGIPPRQSVRAAASGFDAAAAVIVVIVVIALYQNDIAIIAIDHTRSNILSRERNSPSVEVGTEMEMARRMEAEIEMGQR